MTRALSLLILFFSLSASVFAQGQEDSLQMMMDEYKKIDSIEKSLHYKTGKIELTGGNASITVPANFKFLEAAEAKYVIEDLWGNPHTHTPLGLLLPASSSATGVEGYAFVINYESLGFVKDGDAGDINYDDLLKDMKEGSAKENEERKKAGCLRWTW